MLVSEIEKNAEISTHKMSAITCTQRGIASTVWAGPLQLQHREVNDSDRLTEIDIKQ
jgi:hypothetical protein